ncbi:MAG: DUF368 domain-containing protein [Tenacibaculum sp.]
MNKTIKHYLLLGLKGMAMGAADVVPGVSGGTIALISGIYQELLKTLSSINTGLLQVLLKEGVKKAWIQLNGNFLISLFLGILISILSLAKIIAWLLKEQPILLWSFFFGLVSASIIYLVKQVSRWNFIVVILFAIGTILAYYLTVLSPLETKKPSDLFLFLAGALAICAMILPGISGSFILLLLGVYKPVLEAINNKNLYIIALVGAGAFAGLLIFSRALKWLFVNYKNYTLAVLAGFILGSLNKIWPWKKALLHRVNSEGTLMPLYELSVLPSSYRGNPQLLAAITLAVLGFSAIVLLEKTAVKKPYK